MLLTALPALLLVCGTPRPAGQSRAVEAGKPLPQVEVREYQGQKLGSASDFHENSIKGPRHIDKDKYRLTIDGLVDSSRVFTYDGVLGLFPHYKKVVHIYCVEGWDVNILWEGVLVKDVLNSASIRPEAKVAIFHAQDGYTTSLPLDYLLGNDIMMAYNMNDVQLRPERGFPFELVAQDKWGYKWIKWITRIELSSDTNYRGYWESRGYLNQGNLKERFFER
jgi:DMSO/TMAO reductase YedYZ molybdopterin-dependent catalytic subunit